ncbi:MAG TPA: alpha-L-rhamnosidase C-terminal domain-containing protein [Planctomycetota bacterium]|nr:alpha-L-rhamnosidase C-terminal domain-containing protein [Planctomycetota bacterium]
MPQPPSTARAHARSRRFIIDPDYTLPGPAPAARVPWLMLPGDREAWQLARLRHDGKRDCQHVFHPGLFRTWSPLAVFERRFDLATAPRALVAEIRACGGLRLVVNGRVLTRGRSGVFRIDLAPALRAGANHLKALLTTLEGPAAVRLVARGLATDATWSASRDDMHWGPPEAIEVATGTPLDRAPSLRRVRGARLHGGVFDFGVEVIGRIVVRTRGSGAIAVTPGESLAEALAVPPPDDRDALDQPITRGRAGTRASVTTEAVAARYVRVDGAGAARVVAVEVQAEFEPFVNRGAFACSDERLTRIWMNSAYTLRLCVRDGLLIDGLKRDRMPWVGDCFLAALAGAYAFGDAAPVRRTLIALAPFDAAACHANGIIDYTLYWLLALDAHRLHADDAPTLARLWPDARRALAALAAQEDGHGFLAKRADDWLFIDWADVDKDGSVPALQWLYAWALAAAAAVAAALGDGGTARAAATRRARLLAAIDARLWDATRGCYADRGRPASRHAQLIAVLAGAPRSRRVALARALSGALPPVGTPWMRTLEGAALAALGRIDAMLDSVRDTWGGMLDAGATTFWEAWDASQTGDARYAFYGRPFGKSLCHAWAAGPAWLLPTALLGIRPLAAGWSRIAVAPARCDLDWISATVPTPKGPLHVDLDGSRLRVRAPRGVEVVRPG